MMKQTMDSLKTKDDGAELAPAKHSALELELLCTQ